MIYDEIGMLLSSAIWSPRDGSQASEANDGGHHHGGGGGGADGYMSAESRPSGDSSVRAAQVDPAPPSRVLKARLVSTG